MNPLVSKVRAKMTKSREKKAGRTGATFSLRESRIFASVTVAVLWLAVVLIVGMDRIVSWQRPGAWLTLAADAALLLMGLLMAAMFMEIARPHIAQKNSSVLLLCLVSLVSILPAKLVLYVADVSDFLPYETAQFLLPFAMAPLLATILAGSMAGIAVGVWNSLAIAVMANGNFVLFTCGMIASLLAAKSARGVRTRSKVFRIGLTIGLAQTVAVFTMVAMAPEAPQSAPLNVLHQAATCIASAVLSAVVSLMILPAFEAAFHITTNISLLEISDLGHPLLQRLAIEAPGTYHHSLVVANLAQAAADEIGANSLLARVASYFHDIGKLTKPEFFAENIQLQNNPHDDLPPSMSTLVITAHVKEGISLAMHYKLPDPILRVIREHHGTSLLSFFHHKARSQLEFELAKQEGASQDGAGKIDEGAFRYPGPKPSSRESAIVCLADAVEATSRSMEKMTPSHIEGMVTDIVNMRFEDGQLGDSELTLVELTKIQRSFVFTLTNMLHGRVPYPKDENRDKQQAKAAPPEQGGNRKAEPVPSDQDHQAESGQTVG